MDNIGSFYMQIVEKCTVCAKHFAPYLLCNKCDLCEKCCECEDGFANKISYKETTWNVTSEPQWKETLQYNMGGPQYCTCTYANPCDTCAQSNAGHSYQDVIATFSKLISHLAYNFNYKPNEEELEQTPRRLYQMYQELLRGYSESPELILNKIFKEECNEVISQKNIEFVSLCQHHWMPFKGVIHFGYLPKEGNVVGLSKIPRLVECFARRFQSQEQMTKQIVDSFMEHINPQGCIAISEAEHLCYQIRGPKSKATTIVSAVRGCFADNPDIKSEFLSRIGK